MNTQAHDELVSRVVRQLEQRFYRDIHANVQGVSISHPVATQLKDAALLPDVTVGCQEDPRYLIEVEVEETLSDEKAQQRWMAVAKLAAQYQSKFWIAVPKGLRDTVVEQLSELGIDAKIWEV